MEYPIAKTHIRLCLFTIENLVSYFFFFFEENKNDAPYICEWS